MFLRFELMTEELGGDGSKYWDITGFLAGTNYSEKVEVTFKFVIKERPDLRERALKLLRPAVAAWPDAAVLHHILANTLVQQHGASQMRFAQIGWLTESGWARSFWVFCTRSIVASHFSVT